MTSSGSPTPRAEPATPPASAAVDLVAGALRAAGWEVDTPPYRVDGRTGPATATPSMGASPNAGYFVQGGTGRRRQAGPLGGGGAGARRRADAGRCRTRARDVFSGHSDYDAFVAAGIPSGGVLAADEDDKTGEGARKWGGCASAGNVATSTSDCSSSPAP